MVKDGILGLSPIINFEAGDKHEIKSNVHQSNILESFFEQGLIKGTMFAIHSSLENDTQERRLVLGGYDEQVVEKARGKMLSMDNTLIKKWIRYARGEDGINWL